VFSFSAFGKMFSAALSFTCICSKLRRKNGFEWEGVLYVILMDLSPQIKSIFLYIAASNSLCMYT
jgi:phosphopantetheine adenylyltransferase